MHRLVALIVLVPLLVACGGSSKTGSPVSTPAASKPTTTYGESATTIAGLITGCTNVAEGDIGNGGASGLKSEATCTLSGRSIIVESWADSQSEDGVRGLFEADNVEGYYASGTGWTAMTSDAGNDGADIDGEKTAATQIAAALGGEVQHVTA